MNTRIVPIKLADDVNAKIEVIVVDPEQDVSPLDKLNLESVFAGVGAYAKKLQESFATAKPSKICCEFGVKFGYDAGSLIGLFVKGTADANVKITLEWTTK